MGSLAGFVAAYLLGGVTFIPLLVLLYVYLVLPVPGAQEKEKGKGVQSKSREQLPDVLRRPTDDEDTLKSGTDVLAEKFQRTHEGDVAAGYFAVCREYVPGGVNGKPPERTTPAGDVVVAESPSVYQTMYRSIFDRKQAPTIDPAGKGNGKNVRNARNVFYVVLRHGHLMLYDDADQIEVRYVISLAHHNVSIYGSEPPIPEGELWIKRNAICLTRKPVASKSELSRTTPFPFYLFSDNLSDKEDFYFAILNNLERDDPYATSNPPVPEHFNVENMITLVRRLHSSEEHLQTRWFNALVGRLFLALYKTEFMETLLWEKLSKKISRVQKPNFITRVALQKIDAGEGPPLVTNPRLKDLTIDGDCCVEADIDYTGNARVQVAATARIELGTRFKPREVDLVLAVVLKKLKGRVLLRFKPPPSNRLWLSFDTMPSMDMAIEPIVSSRQITLGLFLRAIESRIREVVAETLVQPFWDDIPFLDTEHQEYRGGIWHRGDQPSKNTVIPDETGEAQDSSADGGTPEQQQVEEEESEPTSAAPSTISDAGTQKSSKTAASERGGSISSGVDKSNRFEPSRTIRARTMSHAADPVVTASPINVNPTQKPAKGHDKDATSEMMKISSRSQPNSPTSSPVGSPQTQAGAAGETLNRSLQTRSTQELGDTSDWNRPRTQSASTTTTTKKRASDPAPGSEVSQPLSRLNTDTAQREIIADGKRELDGKPSRDTRQTANALGTAAATAAKKLGLNVFNRGGQAPKVPQRQASSSTTASTSTSSSTLDKPMGRGRPLPPPGTPLPPPDRSSYSSKSITMPKRKAVPPPVLPERPQASTSSTSTTSSNRPVPKPPLPKRPSISSTKTTEEPPSTNDLMVVQAPDLSEPESPGLDEASDAAWDTTTNTANTAQADASSISSSTHRPDSSRSSAPDSEKKLV